MWSPQTSINNNNRQLSSYPLVLATIVCLIVNIRLSVCQSRCTISDPKLDKCINFSSDSGSKHEIYSPNYPGKYPNNTECKRIIEAPMGKVIRLEFQQIFDIEKSNGCLNDYLEVRDGQRGFSTEIGRYCGSSFPGTITSTDRFLWLFFKSDDSIEHGGFKIVYSFIDLNQTGLSDLTCYYRLGASEGRFGTSDIPPALYNHSITYKVPLNCVWEIEVQYNLKIFLNITSFSLANPNDCKSNVVDIYTKPKADEKNKENMCKDATVNIAHFCGSVTEPKSSEGNKMNFVLYEDFKAGNAQRSSVEVMYTAYREIKPEENCDSVREFDCKDNTCINITLKCNNNINCKYKTDEEDCEPTQTSAFSSKQVQVILIVGLALLIGIMVPSCLNFYRKVKYGISDEESVADPSSVHGSMGQRTIEGSLHDANNIAIHGGGGGVTNIGSDDDDGCYVPEVDLSIFLKRSNGGHSISIQDSPPLSGEDTPLDSTLPNNFDSADPLITTTPTSNNGPPFLAHVAPLVPQILHKKNGGAYYRPCNYNDSPRTSTPPPPPPPLYYNGLNSFDSNSCYTPESDNNNSLLMPPPPTLEEVEESDAIFGLPSMSTGIPSGRLFDPRGRFKAEAIVEAANRPRSFESTKSAPDVIGRI